MGNCLFELCTLKVVEQTFATIFSNKPNKYHLGEDNMFLCLKREMYFLDMFLNGWHLAAIV